MRSHFASKVERRVQHFASNPVVRFAQVHPHVGYLQDILT